MHLLVKVPGAILVLALLGMPGHAAQASDEAVIRQMGLQWQEAWNRRDAQAMAELMAADVDFVSVLGPLGWLKGRPEFLRAHAGMFTTLFTESTWSTNETHVRFVQPDLAIAHVLWSTTGDKVRHVKHGTPRAGIFTWVVQKQQGRWLVIASQNTESMPILPGQ